MLKSRLQMYEAQEKAWYSREQELLSKINELNSVQQNDVSTKTKTNVSGWWWFLSGAVLMFALIFFLKRFPYTAWLFKWL